MTLNDYRMAYSTAETQAKRISAHAQLVRAEQELARKVAPIYAKQISITNARNLEQTGEYAAFNAAAETIHITI